MELGRLPGTTCRRRSSSSRRPWLPRSTGWPTQAPSSPRFFGAKARGDFRKYPLLPDRRLRHELIHAGVVARLLDREPRRTAPAAWRSRANTVTARASPDPRALVVVISQFGREPPTRSPRLAMRTPLGQHGSLAICNVPESSLIRSSRAEIPDAPPAPEIGGPPPPRPSPRNSPLCWCWLWSSEKTRGRISREKETEYLEALRQLPAALAGALRTEPGDRRLGGEVLAVRGMRCSSAAAVHYPIAMEGAPQAEGDLVHPCGRPMRRASSSTGRSRAGSMRAMPVIADRAAPMRCSTSSSPTSRKCAPAGGGALRARETARRPFAEEHGVHVIRMGEFPGVPIADREHRAAAVARLPRRALPRQTTWTSRATSRKSVTVE